MIDDHEVDDAPDDPFAGQIDRMVREVRPKPKKKPAPRGKLMERLEEHTIMRSPDGSPDMEVGSKGPGETRIAPADATAVRPPAGRMHGEMDSPLDEAPRGRLMERMSYERKIVGRRKPKAIDEDDVAPQIRRGTL